MIKINKKFLFPAVFTILLIALCFLVFKIAYIIFIGKSYSSYEGTIKAYVTKINNINIINFEGELSDETIPPLIKSLSEKVSSLSKIKSEISSLNPTEKYRTGHQNLLSGIESNILIYKQIEGILNNPKGSDLDNSSKLLSGYWDKTKTGYRGASDIKEISFTGSLNSFINDIIEFANENSRINKDNEIKLSQREDFINSVSDVINKFINLKRDFYADAYNARSSGGDLSNVLLSINDNKVKFKTVKSDFSKISVPSSEENSTYESLKSLLASYDSYLQTIAFSVSTEIIKKENGSNLTDSDIESMYADSKAAYSLTDKNYNTFISKLENLKIKNN